MFGRETTRITAWLDNAGYTCIDSLDDLTYTTYPVFEGLKPVYFGNLPYFITGNALLTIHPKTGALTAEYLSQGEVVQVPLVSEEVNENVFQYYVEVNKISSSVAGFVNGIPIFYISMFEKASNKPDLTGTRYRPLAVLYSKGTESIGFFLGDGTTLNPSSFYKNKPSDLLSILSPDKATELFTRGYTTSDKFTLASTTKLFGSTAIPLPTFKTILKTLGWDGLLATLKNQNLTGEQLVALSPYVSSDILRQLWVTHTACTEKVRETVFETYPNETLLTEIAQKTTSKKLLQKILNSGMLTSLSIGEALSKNPTTTSKMVKKHISCFTSKMVDDMLFRQEVNPLAFVSLLNLEPGHPLLKSVPHLIDCLLETNTGSTVILNTLLREDKIAVNNMPKEVLRQYALEELYLSRMKPKPKDLVK